MKFEKFHLAEDIMRNLHDMGFYRTTDIQFKVIPSALKGEDILAIAHTGTGKTAAFAIPIVNVLHAQKKSKRTLGIKCLVMVPTRELSEQIGEVFNALSKHTKVKATALFGGVEKDPQILKVQEGIDILITTPGRMFDLIRNGYIHLDNVEILVLDEADRMLDLGFIKDVQAVKKKLTQKHQTMFFSATINSEIKKLAYSQVRSNAIHIQISPDDPISKNISHFVVNIKKEDKKYFLTEYIHKHPSGKFIVFVRTRVRAERVSKAISKLGISSLTIHGEKDQLDRVEVMKNFRLGVSKILIATDVSARGIDIADVTHVINYDLPDKAENYVHRIGRTGRGFNKGLAISFCGAEEKDLLEEIQNLIGKPIEEIKISKNEYKFIISQNSQESDAELPLASVMKLIEEEEGRGRNRKKK